MLELTGMGSVLRGIGFLYWTLAIGAVIAAINYGRGARGKIIWSVIAVAVFSYLPGKALIEQHQRDVYANEAWAYFKKKCDTEAGEKIYKTYSGVKSVLVVKALPPATEKDLYDQFWYGDPYSDSTPWDERGQHAAGKLASPKAPIAMNVSGKGFDFVELNISQDKDDKSKTVKYFFAPWLHGYGQQTVQKSVSKFGIAWVDISTPEDRKYWVAASRLEIINLEDKSVVAERIGYYIESGFGSRSGQRLPWLTSKGPNTTCPYSHDWSDRWFILKVLSPAEENFNGK